MEFWLGVHRPNWLEQTDVPLMVSNRTLATRKTLPRARGRVMIDCGGFSELQLFGEWRTSGKTYARLAQRYVAEIGNVEWIAAQDLMCEPFMLARTGLSVQTHQAMTVAGYLEGLDRAPGVPWLPVLQGWTPADYLRHVDMYAVSGVDLTALPLVGIGSVCRRQHLVEARYTVQRLSALGIRLHGFGVKTAGLPSMASVLVSSDSMAWGNRALNQGERGRSSAGANYVCPAGSGRVHTVKSGCANCLHYALEWRRNVLRQLDTSTPMFGEVA